MRRWHLQVAAGLLWQTLRAGLAAAGTCDSADGTCAAHGASTEGGQGDFFRSYGTAWVQAEMLQDEVRTKAFRDAILGNRDLFEGKIVLDVGAGTGILSLFAARAGAKRVFAIERSDMAAIARQIVADSGLSAVVEVIHGLVEEVKLPVPQVDIIISEWIGTFLIHESMLDSVLFARDKWLAPDGLLLPDSASLYIAGVEDQGSDHDAWADFYGFNFSALGTAARQVGAQQCVFRNSLATEPAVALDLDLYSMTVSEQEFAARLSLSCRGGEAHEMHAVVSWFNLSFFNISRGCAACGRATPSVLTTHPDATCTHWQQTLFSLPRPVNVKPSDAVSVGLGVRRARATPRDLEVRLTSQGDHAFDETFQIVGADL